MTMERFHRPPRPSTPMEAPWTELELLHSDIRELIDVLRSGLGIVAPVAPIEITVPPVEPTPVEVIVTPTPTTPGPTPTPTPTPTASFYERIFKATSGSKNSITVKGANWETNMWQGWELEIVVGTGVGQCRRIISNTYDKLVPRRNFDDDPDNTSIFVLRPRYPMDNPNDFRMITKTVTLTTTPERLTEPETALTVPNGWPVLLLANPGNSGYIYISYSLAAVNGSTTRFDYLEAGKSMPLYVTKTDLIWLAVSSDGDSVSAYVPQWAVDST